MTKLFAAELLIIVSLVVVINNFLVKNEVRIISDGVGYYDYLPAMFIHHDIHRKNFPFDRENKRYHRISQIDAYVPYADKLVNKYSCGTAILHSPFFFWSYLQTVRTFEKEDGYQREFHRTAFYSALFYLFLGIVFFKLLLETYYINKWVIVLMQFLLVFGTSMIHYVNYESMFSHVYSFFAITCFLYFARNYFLHRKLSCFLWACLLFGVVILLRQVNGIILLAVPFIAGSLHNLKTGIRHVYSNKLHSLMGLSIVVIVVSFQLLFWYLQTGVFFVYSYQGESFDFSNPEFFNILFSYKKGLFVYTPILFFAFSGILVWLLRRNFFEPITWVFFFFGTTYVLSSWWSWFYGCSFGLRAYIDFYALFFVLIGLFFNSLKKWVYIIPATGLTLLTIPVALIQTHQYNEFILHWIDMDKEKYRKVFLKTDEQYKGLIWKKKPKMKHLEEIAVFDTESVQVESFSSKLLFEIPMIDFLQTRYLYLSFSNEFIKSEKSKIWITVHDNTADTILYQHDRYILHFHESDLGNLHKGEYYFEMPHFPDGHEVKLTVEVRTKAQNIELKNPGLVLFKQK
jgi:hypothetical protein